MPKEQGRGSNEVYQEALGLVQLADSLSFDYYFFPEHHFIDLCLYPNQELIMAAAAVLTKRIQLGSLGFIMNYRNPIRTAETVTMLDNLSNGRIQFGISRGSIEWEFRQFGAAYQDPERREVFQEAFEACLAALGHAPFSYHGKHFNYDNVTLLPQPLRRPHPPLWFPGTQSETSIKWAASHGMHSVTGTISTSDAKRIFDLHKENWRSNQVSSDPILAMFKHTVVAETDEKARETAESPLKAFWNGFFGISSYQGLGTNIEFYRKSILEEADSAKKPWEDFDFMEKHNFALVGDPETVAEKIIELSSETGANCIINTFKFAGELSPERAAQSMRLFSDKVIPMVQDRLGRN